MQINAKFHYIIIGAGAAGCVLANRLSADPAVSVLVLEAGGMDNHPDIADIGGFVKLWGSDMDWKLQTTPQQGLYNRRVTINQGKVLGGSSSINAMMYVRGNAANFNKWHNSGAEGWSYNDVLPCFKKIENYSGGDAGYHGKGGEVSLSDCPDDSMRSPEFMAAVKEAGYSDEHKDYNGDHQANSACYLQFHIDEHGKRESGATAFLHPVMHRPNLTVLTGAYVKKIIIEAKTATGVEYLIDGQQYNAIALNEVILSAGALASPKILMLSGIGPAEDLKALEIDSVHNLPGVGLNLQDHLQLPILFKTTVNLPHTTLLTGNVLFVKTAGAHMAPNIQINFTPSIPVPLEPLLPDLGFPVCIFLAILVQPQSRGTVRLSSANCLDAPVINSNYLSSSEDVKSLEEAIHIIRKISAQPAFSNMIVSEAVPANNPLEGFIRSQSSTLWHPAGTCKMGVDDNAVVDSDLRVHGIKNLRVADASIMPTVTSGNTVATCFMIGERASEMIIKQNTLQVAIN